MSKILELLVSLSVAGSTVVVFILLLRLIPPDVLPAKWRYAIGKMAVGFYLLPIALVIQWLWPLFIPKQTATVPISGLPASAQQTQPDLTTGAIPELNLSANTALIFLSIWGTGALVFAIWQVYCYRKFIKKLQQTRSPVPENSEAAKQLTLMKEALGMQSNVQLAYSSVIRSPVLVGLWKPTIYLPMENLPNVDIGMVIHHELIHLKRKDLWVKATAVAASALHWFNPFVHILRKGIHTWSELSCDEEVVKGMSHAERKRYGETILNVMVGSRGMPVRFCASLSGDGKQLKRRLNMMLNVKKLKKHTVIITAAAVIAVGAIGTSTAVWAAKKTPEVRTDVNNSTKEDVGGKMGNAQVTFIRYSALSDYEKEVATKDIAKYYVDKERRVIEDREGELVPFDTLSAEEQQRVSIEDGYFPDNLLTPKEVRQRMLEDKIITEEEFKQLNEGK